MRFNNKLDGTRLRMVEDDTFFDVTTKDVSTLLNRMPRTYSRDEVIRIRTKDKDFFNTLFPNRNPE